MLKPPTSVFMLMSLDGKILCYMSEFDLKLGLISLKEQNIINQTTVRSARAFNKDFLISDSLEYINIIIAPVSVGEDNDLTEDNKKSIVAVEELNRLINLQLLDCNEIEENYVYLKYRVVH